MRKIPAIFACAIAVSFLPQIALAQKRAKPKLNDDVALPADFAVDYQLGLSERGKIRGTNSLLEGTAYNEAGTAVFSKLIQNTSVSSLGLPYK